MEIRCRNRSRRSATMMTRRMLCRTLPIPALPTDTKSMSAAQLLCPVPLPPPPVLNRPRLASPPLPQPLALPRARQDPLAPLAPPARLPAPHPLTPRSLRVRLTDTFLRQLSRPLSLLVSQPPCDGFNRLLYRVNIVCLVFFRFSIGIYILKYTQAAFCSFPFRVYTQTVSRYSADQRPT